MSTSNLRKVYINGPDVLVRRMFMNRAGYVGVPTIEEADIVVFTGGADVHPSVYNEKVDPAIPCAYNHDRDHNDLIAFGASENKFKVGICRGGQFLNVMNDGKLWYDVDNHTQSHFAYEPNDMNELELPFMVTSTHHQQFIKGPDAQVFLVAYQSTIKVNANDQWNGPKLSRAPMFAQATNTFVPQGDEDDLEGVYYPKTGSMCFQPHPEYVEKGVRVQEFFFEKLEHYYESWAQQQAKAA